MPDESPKPIIRSHCSIPFITPSGGTINLPVNCANYWADNSIDPSTNPNRWPWKRHTITTLSTNSPQTTAVTEESTPYYSVSADTFELDGQTVLRTMFAYVATHPVYLYVDLRAGRDIIEDPEGVIRGNFKMYAKIFNPSGGVVRDLIDFEDENGYYHQKEFEGIAEATVCPLIVFAWCSVQPTGAAYLPTTGASIDIIFGPIN